MSRIRYSILLFILVSVSAFPQKPISFVSALSQQSFPGSVKAGNYSGITSISGNVYALVDDKSPNDGFYLFDIDIDSVSGNIKSVVQNDFRGNSNPNRDSEGIVYVPGSNTLFVSGEADMKILEYNLDGTLTGRSLVLPEVFKHPSDNYGFESLAYNRNTHLYWTTTESTLTTDGIQATSTNGAQNMLRLQSFGEDLKPLKQYAYLMDAPTASSSASNYAMGVSEMTALDDGRLIVLEREFFVPPSKLGAYVNCKFYVVNPEDGTPISDTDSLNMASPFLKKTELYENKTSLTLFSYHIANYEGMCLGPKLKDGSQTLLLVSDSQNQYKGVLKDWLKVLIIKM